MTRGYPFPDFARLERALVRRGWTPAMLADRAAISIPIAYRVLDGNRVSIETIDRIAKALLNHPPDPGSAIVRFLLTEE